MDVFRPMTLRQQWRDFITHPNHAGRHLTSLGKSIEAAEAAPISLAALEDFLVKLAGGTEDVDLLAGAVDLVCGGYADFCTRQLPPLLDSLLSERLGENAIVGPGLRGNTRWD